MIERCGDIFDQPDGDAICFTSNGVVKANGELVMGGGVAKAFYNKQPGLAKEFGFKVKAYGNHVHWTGVEWKQWVVSFPTKNHWKNPSSLKLIAQSAKELVELTNEKGWKKVYLPYPGIGLGGLNKEDVRKVISPILDDRFIVLVK